MPNRFPGGSFWTEEPVWWKQCRKRVRGCLYWEIRKIMRFCCEIWPDGEKKTERGKTRKKRKENRAGSVQNDFFCRHSSSKSLKTNVGSVGLILHYLVLFTVRSYEEIALCLLPTITQRVTPKKKELLCCHSHWDHSGNLPGDVQELESTPGPHTLILRLYSSSW